MSLELYREGILLMSVMNLHFPCKAYSRYSMSSVGIYGIISVSAVDDNKSMAPEAFIIMLAGFPTSDRIC